MTSGRRVSHAATPPGPVTKPPNPTTSAGSRLQMIRSACQMECISLNGAANKVSAPLPRRPLIDSHSMAMFSAGITRASRPVLVPSHTTSCEAARNRRASASAGNT